MDPIWAVTWAAIYHQVVKSIPYCHPSIPPGNDSIRLLRLIPNRNKSAIIECELLNCSLEPGKGTHLYEALSYVWGNPIEIVPIFIDGRILSVTTNLYAALLRLRDRDIARTVWIDAICIDQANQEEKERQIQSMAKIYGHASRVIVWLGEAADDSDLALEAIRLAGAKKSTNSLDSERIQQAVLALLQRPWFRRIWILQEVAAARHVLITCGSERIDGYAFCLGIDSSKSFYEAYPDLQGLIRSVIYLIREAIFRPSYSMSSSSRSSLDICPLGELMDMYHAHEATKRHDKVYALLGMSSDDLSKVDLLPDYGVPWEELLQRLAKFLLSEKISVEACRDREIAVIKSKGRILGKVTSVQSNMARDDRQGVDVTFKNIPGQPEDIRDSSAHWTLHVSAKSIQEGDLICLLQGASKPAIIRSREDHFTIVKVGVTPLKDVQKGSGYSKWSNFSQSFTRDFVLIWDWESSSDKLQELGEYETLILKSKGVPKHPKTELGSHLDKATRTWNVALILGDVEEYGKAEER
ncbi:heterokaryon incompatibility protein-domain-containing protein, partial [Paraphoma chrysanthemicola]